MGGAIGLLAAPFVVCLLIAALHCYMGLHIVRRGVIFVDLALAQLAALGATLALLVVPLIFHEPLHHHEEAPPEYNQPAGQVSSEGLAAALAQTQHAPAAEPEGGAEDWLIQRTPYALSLLFTLVGAAIFAVARFRDERVPQEAIIGIVFVVSAALAVLVLSRAPHGHEAMESMLVGNILFVGWRDVLTTLLLYAPLGVLHYLVRDFLFYASFGLMVTQSVRLAGVLVVFSYLIIPAVCAGLLARGFRARLLIAWAVALVASVVGLFFSAAKDMPTGPSLVATFGAILVTTAVVQPLFAMLLSRAPSR
jgi:zinc/manganese transport system permease protein